VKLAYDKSARRYDADGRLHVERCRISKANVCPYRGDEIPDGEKLGLDPNRIYYLYRAPEELAKAAATFANIPLTLHHVPVNVDAPAQELVVGVIGSDVSFEAPYLVASLAVWTRDGVDAIETRAQEQLSSGYRYRAEMVRGLTPEGVAFDGIMRDIVGNHVALVSEGRAGPDVVVADGAQKMRFKKTTAILASILGAAFTNEQQLAFDTAMKEDLDAAKDELPELSEDEKSEAKLAMCKKLGRDTLTEEEETEAYRAAASDKKAKDSNPAASNGNTPPHAADSAEAIKAALESEAGKAAIQLAVDAAVATAREGYVLVTEADTARTEYGTKIATDTRAEVLAFLTAREAVAEKVGLIALDSSTNTAEAVYRFALDKLEVDHKATPASALPALYAAATKSAPNPGVALDSAASAPNVRDLFPGLASIYRG
jgi:hypothetical protein